MKNLVRISAQGLLCFVLLLIGCTKKQDLSQKVLYQRVKAEVKGFDPIQASDSYASREVSKVYETLYEYHYLKRPYTLVPNLAKGMPIISKDGSVYTVKIKKGVLFHDNKCFPGELGREMKAEDVAYSIKRLADPKLSSPNWWLLDGKIKGLNEWREEQKRAELVNYDLPIEGLKVIDDYTIEFVLAKPFPQFLYSLAMSGTAVVAREAVAMYGKEFINNPVGTGPFITGVYNPLSNKIIYYKNPKFREKFYPIEGEQSDKANGLLKSAGARLPFLDKIITHIVVEHNPAWLTFLKGQIDELEIPKDNFDSAIAPDKSVQTELAAKGISVEIEKALDITYVAFNHDHKLFKNNVNLRRAMSLAYDGEKANKLFYHGLGIMAQTIIPPEISGYDEKFKNEYASMNLEKAKEYLAKAGYPNGKGLPEIEYDTVSTTVYRQLAVLFAKSMEQIGVKIKPVYNTWPELLNKINNRSTTMHAISWIADYPDAENFLQLLYGANSSPGSNGANYNDPAFNKEFEIVSKMQDTLERTERYKNLAQKVSKQVPWILGVHRTDFYLKQAWLKNHKGTAFKYGVEQYWDIDLEQKRKVVESL